MMSVEYRIPQLPLGGAEVTLVRWLKRPGDTLSPGDPLLIVANDRVEVALPAVEAGILEATLVAEGATALAGVPVARIARGPAAAADEGRRGRTYPAPTIYPAPANEQEKSASGPRAPRRVSPVARRIADASSVDITSLSGSGPGGRILKGDVLAAIEDRGLTTVQAPYIVPRRPIPDATILDAPTPMRRAIAVHMLRSRATSPHALTAMDVDMGRVAEARTRSRTAFARRGIDLTYTACIALAAVESLLLHPLLNSSWSDAGIILRRRVHLGIAVALPDGLITPVVREAQDLNLRGLARAVADMARRARAGALRPGESSGATFTITNPGAGALWFGTPIISQPQSAILGVGAVRQRPLVISEGDGDRIVVRPTALLTLAYDARVLDQSHADAFLCDVKRKLEHFESWNVKCETET
jgi:2-oxoglutarate dehydrogenase E2 component (dihydrolipoamide succinyltransferase)